MNVRKKCTGTLKPSVRRFTIFLAVLALLAGSVYAQGTDPDDPKFWAGAPELSLPLECRLDGDARCFIAGYVDHDLSDGVADYQCGARSYNEKRSAGLGHGGTDFALYDWLDWQRGAPVQILASAAGVVSAIRDGVIDDARRSGVGSDQACGNAVIIDHGRGWITQYCHLKQDSLAVAVGDRVETGSVLGLMGSSGWSSFPHLHFSVFRQVGGKQFLVDPFTSTLFFETCRRFRSAMWSASANARMPYTAAAVIKMGFSGREPNAESLLRDTRPSQQLSWRQDDGIWPFFYATGIAKGHLVRMTVLDPDGTEVYKATLTVRKASYRTQAIAHLNTSKFMTAQQAKGIAPKTGRYTLRAEVANVARRVYLRRQATVVITD